MRKYKILFIDEEKDSHDDFSYFISKHSEANKIEAITSFPLRELDSMIENIIEINPDAIISDFLLNEIKESIDYKVSYNGAELIEKYLTIRNDFPCFVLTAYDDRAINEVDDVNKIYVKNIFHKKNKDNDRVSFIDKVMAQIKHYQYKLKTVEKELLELLEKREKGETDYKEEQRIIELDTILEKSIDKRAFIPSEYKNSSNVDRLNELLSKVDKLIEKVEKDNEKL